MSFRLKYSLSETECLITAGLADVVALIPARADVTQGLY